MTRRSRTLAAAALGVVTLAVVGIILASPGSGQHDLRARFATALDVTRGQEVRIGGSKVGSVDYVRRDGAHVLVGLRIGDDAWPLPASTRARLRWGASTVTYGGRFVQLDPGRGKTQLAENGVISLANTTSPVEFDQVYSVLDKRTRPRLQSLLGNLDSTVRVRPAAIREALQRTPDGLTATSRVFEELGRDQYALATLVDSGAGATSAIARQDPHLRSLVTQAAGTFDEFADNAPAIQASLDELPSTLRRTRAGLRRLDASVPRLQGLVSDLRPGARRLRTLAPVLGTTADRLQSVAPLATTALGEANRNARPITNLLKTGTPFARSTTRALSSFAPMAACLRPYGPEIASFFATWSGFGSRYSTIGHYARALPPADPIPHGTPLDAEQSIKASPPGSVSYAMPRPPGYNVGQTWFQPQCGAGPDALNAAKDPEKGK